MVFLMAATASPRQRAISLRNLSAISEHPFLGLTAVQKDSSKGIPARR